MGQQSNARFSNFHQVLNRARWSALEGSHRLLQVLMSTFGGGAMDIVIDETLERRWGRKIHKRGHYRDSLLASQGAVGKHQWITLDHHGLGGDTSVDEAPMGVAILQCLGDSASGERSTGAATQDHRPSCPTNGSRRASLAARGSHQSNRR